MQCTVWGLPEYSKEPEYALSCWKDGEDIGSVLCYDVSCMGQVAFAPVCFQ